jgi:hypothetical protein
VARLAFVARRIAIVIGPRTLAIHSRTGHAIV